MSEMGHPLPLSRVLATHASTSVSCHSGNARRTKTRCLHELPFADWQRWARTRHSRAHRHAHVGSGPRKESVPLAFVPSGQSLHFFQTSAASPSF